MNRLSFLAYSAMLGVALVPSSVLAQQQGTTLRQQLIGTWEIVSTSPENRPGAQILGTNPKGVFMLGGSGKYAVTFENRNRPKAAERSADGFVANFGTWSVNEADKTLASFCRKSQDSPVDPALFEFSTGAIFACFFD